MEVFYVTDYGFEKLESARHIWTLEECCEKYKKHLQNKSHRQVEYEKEYRGS